MFIDALAPGIAMSSPVILLCPMHGRWCLLPNGIQLPNCEKWLEIQKWIMFSRIFSP